MSKREIGLDAFVYPMSMVVAGADVDGRPNFLAVGWVTRVNYRPPMIAIALGKTHHTNQGIRSSGAFSVNVPGLDLLEKVDYCGLVSGKNVDKSGLFTVTKGPVTGAPMVDDCHLCIECEPVQTVDLPSNEVFIGEIVGAWADENCLVDGRPDITKLNPFTLTMPDNNYWKVGEKAGKAWSAGKALRKKAREGEANKSA
ncbi:MAG: flavin reductase family protein [Candidatus Riflebacteria bacterium]|nr:flavin reductase family protein [Candidatus Riflebacteria bacterium]